MGTIWATTLRLFAVVFGQTHGGIVIRTDQKFGRGRCRSRMNATPQAVRAHALLYKTLTRRTRRRIKKPMGAATDADHNKRRSTELRRVAHGLNDVALGMDRVATTETILTDSNDLAPLKEDRNVIAGCVLRRVAPSLREHVAVHMLLDPSGKHVRVINLLI